MPSKKEVWAATADMMCHELQSLWNSILIDGENIEQKYGVTKDTCARFKVGYAPPDRPLLDWFRKDLKLSVEDIKTNRGFGLIAFPNETNRNLREHFRGRVMFPHFQNDEVVFWSGRRSDKTPRWGNKKAPKFLHMSLDHCDLDGRPIYLDINYEETHLVEGCMQSLRLRQEGFSACGLNGNTNFSDAIVQKLRRVGSLFRIPDCDTLRAEPAQRTETQSGPVIKPPVPLDRKYHAFIEGMGKIPHCRLITYPETFIEANKKGDQNDWWHEHPDQEDFMKLRENALDFNDILCRSISTNASAYEQANSLSEIAKIIAPRSEIEIGDLKKKLKSHLKLPAESLREFGNQIKLHRAEGTNPTDATDAETDASDFIEIRPGQDFKNSVLYYTIWRKRLVTLQEKGETVRQPINRPYIVTSKGDTFPATPSEMSKRAISFRENCKPEIASARWSLDTLEPYSFPAWLENPEKNTPKGSELFEEIRNFFRDFSYLSDENYYDLLAVVTMLTYVVQIFDACGHLGLNGTKATGKSRILQILEKLAWEPEFTSSMSASYMFTRIDGSAVSILMDEAEKFHSASSVKGDISEMSLIVYGAYKKTGRVGRMRGTSGSNMQPVSHHSYTFLAFANIRGYEPTLKSRMILLPCIRCPASFELKPWNERTLSPRAAEIRNKLHCWALSYATKIDDAYDVILETWRPFFDLIGFHGREQEIHNPLFAIASVIDAENGIGYMIKPNETDPPTPHADSLLLKLTNAVMKMVKIKQEEMSAEEIMPTFLAALRQLITGEEIMPIEIPTQTEGHQDFYYPYREVLKYLRSCEGLLYFPKKSGPSSLIPVLCNRIQPEKGVGYIDADLDIVNKYRAPQGSRQRKYLRLPLGPLLEVCKTYDVPENLVVERVDEEESVTSETQDKQESAF